MTLGDNHYIDLNADAGESFGHWKIGQDDALFSELTSVNLACGFHAGDPLVMLETIDLAVRKHVAIGAHPGYPDLVGFGRRHLDMSSEELCAAVIYQVGALKAMLNAKGMRLHHVKAHGALYLHMTSSDDTARAVANAVSIVAPEVPLVVLGGPGGSKMRAAALEYGLSFVNEAFPDRSYDVGGYLLPRSHPNALVLNADLAAERAVTMVKEGQVVAFGGGTADLDVDTLCVHGDNAESVEIAAAIRKALESSGVQLRAF